MATRATYSFQSTGKPNITLYIHHDGYEAGAGHYIAQAFAEGGEDRNDYFTVESFIKANDRAEITGSHEAMETPSIGMISSLPLPTAHSISTAR